MAGSFCATPSHHAIFVDPETGCTEWDLSFCATPSHHAIFVDPETGRTE